MPNMDISTSFCVDRIHGWVALYDPFQDRSSIAITADGGKNWVIHEIGDADWSPTSIYFLNERTGWLMLGLTTSTHMNRWCKMWTTKDGGVRWMEAHPRTFPPCGEMTFVSRRTGWIVGNNGEGDPIRLWVTRDGGNTWNPQALPKPRNCGRCEILAYHAPPQFRDSTHGEFEVEFLRKGMETFDVTYVTTNGGESWKVGKFAKEVPSD